jgi:type VI secretion system protein
MCGLELVKTMRSCHSFNRSVITLASGIMFLLLFTACPKVKVPKTVRRVSGAGDSKLEVKVHVAPKANNNNPVAVDLVLVTDKKLLQELMKMSASEWFEKRHQVELDYPKETGLGAGRWEWVPGQDVKVDRVPVNMDVVGGVIFANYFNAGTHRAPIDPRKGILITLGDESLCVQSLKEPAKPCASEKQSGR